MSFFPKDVGGRNNLRVARKVDATQVDRLMLQDGPWREKSAGRLFFSGHSLHALGSGRRRCHLRIDVGVHVGVLWSLSIGFLKKSFLELTYFNTHCLSRTRRDVELVYFNQVHRDSINDIKILYLHSCM